MRFNRLLAPRIKRSKVLGRAAAAGERGFALLFVIWVLALLAVLATGLASSTRGEAVIARNRVELARARGIAAAGVTLAAYSMLDGSLVTQGHADGSPRTIDYGDGRVTLTLQDEGGKVDLNAAPIELIAGLFASLGIDDAAALAQAIVDRRAAYSSNVTPVRRSAPGNFVNGFGSGNAVFDMRLLPFATVAELRLVPGMTRAAYDRVRPFVTVYSTGAKVNPLTASREVLLGVPGVSPQDVEFLIASRQAVAAGGPSENAPRLSGVDRYVGPSDLHAVTVRAFAVTDGGGNFEREAVVILTDTPLRPIQILEWRQGLDERPRFDE